MRAAVFDSPLRGGFAFSSLESKQWALWSTATLFVNPETGM